MSETKQIAVDDTANEETAVAVKGQSDILALSDDGATEFNQVITENFGNAALTLADLDKIKIPSGGGTRWEIPTIVEGDEDSTKELKGVIIGWADKKSWWKKSYTDSSKEDSKAPDCKSNDMVHGVGNPNSFFNDKEQALQAENKINKEAKRATAAPNTEDAYGYLCASCPHNAFGTAANGGGKACQDKRFVLFLPQDSVLPVLIRVPATSIPPVKEYFKRLAGSRTSYLGVVSSLTLEKVPAAKDYSRIIVKAVRKLTPEELAQIRTFRVPFQTALDADDAVEAGYTDPVESSLDDMPGGANDTAAPAPGEAVLESNVDFPTNPIAKNQSDSVTLKQLGMIAALAREKNVDIDTECQRLMNCNTEDLSKKAASAFIQHLQEADKSDAELTSSEQTEVDPF